MVYYSSNQPTSNLKAIFDALGEPTRRAVLERLTVAGATVTELAEPFPMSLQAFLKHVRALEEAGLVQRKRIGRTNHVTIVPEALQAAASWLIARTPVPLAMPPQVSGERRRHLLARARALHVGLGGRMAIVRRALAGPLASEDGFQPADASARALQAATELRPLLEEALRLYDALSARLEATGAEGRVDELSELVIPLGRLMYELRTVLSPGVGAA